MKVSGDDLQLQHLTLDSVEFIFLTTINPTGVRCQIEISRL